MDVWLTFAYISNSIVTNITCYLYTGYTEANAHAKAFNGDPNAIAVDVTHIPVQIGDTYSNGVFHRGSQVIEPIPSVVEQTELNTNAILAQAEAQAENDALMLDHEERIILLEVGE